ncbi:MAG: DUF3426 domain-containing protein [Woeseiaceae bacterium]|nr:DUF3426 domain-containing protein [Woeseiaceae bacterium]
MYTQCPDCSTGFRITAEVLKQASGKVRCGGCGKAFNALEYLTENMPEQPAAKAVEEPLPELLPDGREGDDGPASISAEQSAALLKTLDELAGSDIRIEDTGVEWRVLNDDDASESAIDELLDESPTPVDEFLTKTPNDVDAAEIFEESANGVFQTQVDELRFDDDTPLPDDFNLDDESSYLPESSESEDSLTAVGDDSEVESADSDNASDSKADDLVGDPDDWADILDDVEELPAPIDDALDDTENASLDDAEDVPLDDTENASLDDADEVPLDDTENASLDDDAETLREDEETPLEFGSVEVAMAELEDQSNVFDEDFFDVEDDVDLQGDEGIAVEPVDEDSDRAVSEDGDDGESSASGEDSEVVATGEPEAPVMDEDTSPGFESIVLEGEFVRTALDDEDHAVDVVAAAAKYQAKLNKEFELEEAAEKRRRHMMVAAGALAVVLLLQVVHQSRDALATIPAFNSIAGPVYRAVGKPLLPEWDVRGWSFEASQDVVTDAGDDQLTIISRLGNRSDASLPYPLINITLIDRFEETIGSHTLGPADYLADGMDPSQRVQPGNTFNAMIAIQSASAAATGYKLKACYRLTDTQLRCKNPDFR